MNKLFNKIVFCNPFPKSAKVVEFELKANALFLMMAFNWADALALMAEINNPPRLLLSKFARKSSN